MPGRRGQLLLIGGLGIAMTFVVLAVVLNTVIFTQNLATREAIDSRSPIEFTNAVEQGVGGMTTEVNYWNTTDYGTLDAEFRQSVSTWAGNTTLLSSARGGVTEVDLRSTTNGTRVLQYTQRQWTNESGDTAWTMMPDVDRTRRFHANVSRSSLPSHSDTGLETSGVFRIAVSDGTDTWRLFIYQHDTTSGVVNVTATGTNAPTTTCQASAEDVDIDITDATLEETDCSFTFAENVSTPYSISVSHGENATGRYTFVVDKHRSTIPATINDSYNQTGTANPIHVPAIYDATVYVSYERADIAYNRTITVAPEDVPAGEQYNVSA